MFSSPGSVGLASSPTNKNPGYGAFPPDLVQLRSTLPVAALVQEQEQEQEQEQQQYITKEYAHLDVQ